MTDSFRFGIEHECALAHATGGFADFTTLSFTELQAVIDTLPTDPDDYPQLRIGDQGIKHKRWYIEGYERFDDTGALTGCDPKGVEIRTRIHDSVDAAASALAIDHTALAAALAEVGLQPIAIGFNPVRSDYPIEPPLCDWERAHRFGSPEERSAHLHMTTYGPDLNLSSAVFEPDELIDIAAKLTYYSPYIVPLSFSSPFQDGAPWGGLSARTLVRTGRRPATMVFLDEQGPHLDTDPSLTQLARIPAEVGRIEFKAFDACADFTLYGELLSLLTGLALDQTLPGRRLTPDAALHRQSARRGLDDPEIRAGCENAIAAASRAVGSADDTTRHRARLESLAHRMERRESRAAELLDRYHRRLPITGLPAAAHRVG